jgi:hypothetical protein
LTTPYDDLPIEVRREQHGWFGEPWWGWTCYDFNGRLIEEMRKAFPDGESCLYCREPFDEAAGDSGEAALCLRADGKTEIAHAHKECLYRSVAGGLAHHEGRCRCHGGTTETPGMTLRQEAVEVWQAAAAWRTVRRMTWPAS